MVIQVIVMNSSITNRDCLYVTGFPPDTERKVIHNEFVKFGAIRKLYLEQLGNFAKVFYSKRESCDLAIRQLRDSRLNWNVQYFDEAGKVSETTKPHQTSSTVAASESVNMARYRNYYEEDDDDFSENFEYCNIHGQPLVVLQADSGELYISLKDIRRTGFALFRRDNFNSVLVDKKQVGKEFDLHLLSEAQNYIIKNRVAVIDEDKILDTIERCKKKLLGGNVNHETQSNFGPGRSVHPMGNSNIVITSDVHQSTPKTNFSTNPISNNRPPRSLGTSFAPSLSNHNSNHNAAFKHKGREHNMNHSSVHRTEEDQRSERPISEIYGSDNLNNHKNKINHSLHSDSGSSDSSAKRRPRNVNKSLEIGETYAVHVCFADEKKDNIFWVQEQKNISTIEEIFLKINEIEAGLEIVTPLHGQLVIALYDGVWNRARVMSVEPLRVHFLDYGNKSVVETVKSLPDDLKKIPEFAVRIVLQASDSQNLNNKTEFTINVKQQYEDGTYLVKIVDDIVFHDSRKINKVLKASESIESLEPLKEPVEPPKETLVQKAYFDIPKPLAELQNGDKIMLIDIEGSKFMTKTRECAQKSKDITEYIKKLDKSALTLPNVKVGQIVICSKDGLEGLYRAVVSKKDSASVVTVKYLDFSGEDNLSVKSLRNVDDYLAAAPSCMLITPEIKGLTVEDERLVEYLAQLCINKEKCNVVLTEDNFDLTLADGSLLSEKLQEIRNPKPKTESVKPPVLVEAKHPISEVSKPVQEKAIPLVKEKPTPSGLAREAPVPVESKNRIEKVPVSSTSAAGDKVTYEEMDWIKLEPGTHTCVCYSLQDVDNLTMIFSSDEVIEHLSTITGYVVTDEEPYKPEALEICFASFKAPDEEEASWYRAAVLEVNDDDYYVMFIDFGNEEIVKSKDIRKLPASLRDIPILGTNCECSGIPSTPKILERLKELIPEGEELTVVVKELKDLKYLIEIPAIYKTLKSEKLC